MLFLQKFRSALGTTQTEQLVRRLTKKRNTGEIRSVGEFSKRLEELLRDLTTNTIKPSLPLHEGEKDEQTHSQGFNDMVDHVSDDLVTGFVEANQVDEVQQAHRAILRDVVLKNLKDGISELEDRISAYEIMNSTRHGFSALISSTFREAAETKTNRASHPEIGYFDPRLGSGVSMPLAQIDIVGERLELDYNYYSYHNVHNLRQVFDSEATYSELSVEPYGSDLTHIIDDTKNTYFLLAQLFTDKPDSITTKLEFELGGLRECNFIEIEPAVKRPIVLTKIEYLDLHQRWIDITVSEQQIDGNISIPLGNFIGSKVRLTFNNINARPISFRYDATSKTLFERHLDSNPLSLVTAEDIAPELEAAIPSLKVKEMLGLSIAIPETFTGFEFMFGMDNIRIGHASFSTDSVYVSQPMTSPVSGTLGLNISENRPYLLNGDVAYTSTTYNLDSATDPFGGIIFGSPDDVHFLGSIEYWGIRKCLKDGSTIKEHSFPLLPLGVEHIYHERLILTDKTDELNPYFNLGYTMFYTDPALSECEFKLYKNGIEAVWSVYSINRTPGSGTQMRPQILVPAPEPGDIFTVSYKPLLSTTHNIPASLEDYATLDGLKVVDLEGDLSVRLVPDQLTALELGALDNTDYDETHIYLMVILRRNTHDMTLSPSLEEYTLMSGYLNRNKLKGLE